MELFLIIARVSFIKDLISGALGVLGLRVVHLQGPQRLMGVGCQEDFWGLVVPGQSPAGSNPRQELFPLFNAVTRPEFKPGAPNWPQAWFIFRMHRFGISFL